MPATTHLKSLQALELAIRSGSLKAAADRLTRTDEIRQNRGDFVPPAAGQQRHHGTGRIQRMTL